MVLALTMLLPALGGSDLRADYRRGHPDPIEYACPEPDIEYRPYRDQPTDCGLSGKTVAIIALGVGLLAYLFGRASVPLPPAPSTVESAVRAVFTDRTNEATKHGINGAVPLLEQARDDALAALKKLGLA